MRKSVFLMMVTLLNLLLITGCNKEESRSEQAAVEEEAIIEEIEETDSREETQKEIQELIVDGEEVCYESENVVIAMSAIGEDAFIDLTISNKSEETIRFDLQEIWINGYEMPVVDFSILEKGEKVERSELLMDDLDQLQLTNVGEVKMLGKIQKHETGEIMETVLTGYRTADYNSMDTEIGNNPVSLMEWEGFVLKGEYLPDGYWERSIIFYIENQTNDALLMECDNVTRNGEEIKTSISDIVQAQSKGILPMLFLGEDVFETGDIIGMTITIKDPENGTVLYEKMDVEYVVSY